MKLDKIVELIIKNNKIRTQAELNEHLVRQGIKTTQPNLSRIIKKINAVKNNEDGDSFYTIPQKPITIEKWIKNLLFSIENNSNNIIVKTYSGAAYIIAEIIDQQNLEEVLGTISGDNTILVIPRYTEKVEELREKLENIFLFKKP